MFILMVTFQIKPDKREVFLQAATEDARSSVTNEPGCLRFDVLQDTDDQDRFHFYEVYRDEAAFEAHTQTPHLLRFREATADLASAPTVRHRSLSVFPPEQSWQKVSVPPA